MIIQTPAPAPLPPTSPIGADPNLLIERVQESVMMVILLIAFTIVAIRVFGPLARAWAHKLEGRVGDPELRAEVDHLRDQLAEVDGLRTRVQELEERVEFAERLLSQKRDQDLLQRGGGV
jgi:Tfp pilus assembly protein PilO